MMHINLQNIPKEMWKAYNKHSKHNGSYTVIISGKLHLTYKDINNQQASEKSLLHEKTMCREPSIFDINHTNFLSA